MPNTGKRRRSPERNNQKGAKQQKTQGNAPPSGPEREVAPPVPRPQRTGAHGAAREVAPPVPGPQRTGARGAAAVPSSALVPVNAPVPVIAAAPVPVNALAQVSATSEIASATGTFTFSGWEIAASVLHPTWTLVLFMTALYSGVDLNAMVAAVGAYFIFMYIDNSKINDVYFCSGTVNIDSVLLVYILTAEVRYFWDRNVMQSAAVAKVWMYLLMTGKLALLIANIVFWKKGRRFRMSFRELMMWTALLLMFMTPAFNSTRKGTQCYVSTLQHCEECSVRWGAGALGAMPVAHTAADVAPETNMVLCTETVTFTASFEDAKDSKHVVNAIKTNATNATQQAIVTSLPAVSTQGAQRKPWVLPPVGSGTNTSSMSAKLRGRASLPTVPVFKLCWMDNVVCMLQGKYAVVLFFAAVFVLLHAAMCCVAFHWCDKVSITQYHELRGSQELYEKACTWSGKCMSYVVKLLQGVRELVDE